MIYGQNLCESTSKMSVWKRWHKPSVLLPGLHYIKIRWLQVVMLKAKQQPSNTSLGSNHTRWRSFVNALTSLDRVRAGWRHKEKKKPQIENIYFDIWIFFRPIFRKAYVAI